MQVKMQDSWCYFSELNSHNLTKIYLLVLEDNNDHFNLRFAWQLLRLRGKY